MWLTIAVRANTRVTKIVVTANVSFIYEVLENGLLCYLSISKRGYTWCLAIQTRQIASTTATGKIKRHRMTGTLPVIKTVL